MRPAFVAGISDGRSAAGCGRGSEVWSGSDGYVGAEARAWFSFTRNVVASPTRNAASARVLEKLGFVLEGTLREDCIVNGDVSDSWVYGLLAREWHPAAAG